MTAPPRPPSPRWEDPTDRHFQALLVVFSAVAVALLLWADSVIPDPGLTVAVPERILEVVRRVDLDGAAVSPSTGAPAPGERKPGLPMPWTRENRHVPQDVAAIRHLRDVFAHPVFGDSDDQMEVLDRVWDGIEFDAVGPEGGAGWVAASGGDGRTDATLPGGITAAELPELTEIPDYAVVPSARYTTARAAPRYQRPAQVSTAAIAAALRGWQHHAARCRTRVAPHFRGRVVIRLHLSKGRVQTLVVESEDAPSTALRECLELRARRLLRFAEDAHGEAVLPLVYE